MITRTNFKIAKSVNSDYDDNQNKILLQDDYYNHPIAAIKFNKGRHMMRIYPVINLGDYNSFGLIKIPDLEYSVRGYSSIYDIISHLYIHENLCRLEYTILSEDNYIFDPIQISQYISTVNKSVFQICYNNVIDDSDTIIFGTNIIENNNKLSIDLYKNYISANKPCIGYCSTNNIKLIKF